MGKFFGFIKGINRAERTAYLRLRFFGIDFDVSFYGYLDDWAFPFMFVPKLWGFYLQSLFAAVYIGRVKGGLL